MQLPAVPRDIHRQACRAQGPSRTPSAAGKACIFRPLAQVPKYPCIILTTGHSASSARSISNGRMLCEKQTSGRH